MSLIDNINYQSSGSSGTLDLDVNTNVYYFQATANITYNYTLPAITYDGQEFRIYRFDIANAATFNINSTNNTLSIRVDFIVYYLIALLSSSDVVYYLIALLSSSDVV